MRTNAHIIYIWLASLARSCLYSSFVAYHLSHSLSLSLPLFSFGECVIFSFFSALIPFSPLAFLHVRKYNSVWLECRTPNNWCTLCDVLVHTILCTINNIETFQTLVESMKSHCCVGKCSIQKSSHIYQCLDLHQAILLWNAHNYFMLQIHSDSTYILHANLLNISIVFFFASHSLMKWLLIKSNSNLR